MSALREIKLGDKMADEVEKLISVGSWRRLMSIRELASHMLTLELLATFEFDHLFSKF